MKRITETARNPFPNSDTNKRYYTYDYYLRKTYGGKCAKVTLDAGFTCPNIDGTRGLGGCIYCSSRGSGDFAPEAALSLREQYEIQTERINQKWDTPRFIPYLQAHTNTYGELSRLRAVYREVLMLPGAVAFHIATRADCLGDDVLSLLAETSEVLPLTVELGLQTVSDEVSARIGRGHSYDEFLDGYFRLRARVPLARVAVHIINGLPTETREDMLRTASTVASLSPHEVKIHLLHVLRGTVLASLYERGEYTPMRREDYVDTVVEQLRLLPPDTVIGRLTGDGKAEDLLAPLWSLKKLTVINEIDKKMALHDFVQGDLCNFNKNII
ncbi:MAG: TIGR01212 family radical SAM protein [Ruminococcaceae bacterium]|nr:TIGR01212 family radical SAM protein [Oscillospiraceae bacterium]